VVRLLRTADSGGAHLWMANHRWPARAKRAGRVGRLRDQARTQWSPFPTRCQCRRRRHPISHTGPPGDWPTPRCGTVCVPPHTPTRELSDRPSGSRAAVERERSSSCCTGSAGEASRWRHGRGARRDCCASVVHETTDVAAGFARAMVLGGRYILGDGVLSGCVEKGILWRWNGSQVVRSP